MTKTRLPNIPPPDENRTPDPAKSYRPAGRGRTAPRSLAAQGRVAPLIRLPRGRFHPPHCPNRYCRFYQPDPDWSFSRWGFYLAPSSPKPLQRFRCASCKRTFSPRTFAVTYWLHHWDLFVDIVGRSVSGSAFRQIARCLEIAHSTVARHLTRAARCCLIKHARLVENATLREPVIVDGFETFEFSQYFPYHAHLAVGQESWFLYHFTDSPLRRKGKMRPDQKRRREELEDLLGRPDPKAIQIGVRDLVRELTRLSRPPKERTTDPSGADLPPKDGGPSSPVVLRLHTDDHPAYRRSLADLRREPGCPKIVHEVTPSTDPRTRANKLFAVNLADLLLRHCGADHRRETIAFGKRRQAGMERIAVFAVWRNTIKRRRENGPPETAAMRAGILDHRWSWRDVFARRLFPRRCELTKVWWDYYHRLVKTPVLGPNQTENRAKFAF